MPPVWQRTSNRRRTRFVPPGVVPPDLPLGATYSKAGNEAHKGCATGCLNGGDGVALASPDGFHLLDITNEAALEHLGMEVTVMGTLDEATNTIKVTSINASS